MALDWIVHRECPTKWALGGDPTSGTQRLVEMLETRRRAEKLVEYAIARGTSPEEISVKLRTETPTGVEEREVCWQDMRRAHEPLDRHAAGCEGCPANLRGRPYGCTGALPYPIPRRAEKWLFARVQPADTFGGQLFLRAVRDFGYDGSPTREMRKRGLFQADRSLQRVVEKRLLRTVTIDSDQLYHAIFGVGRTLDPFHCVGFLLWTGSLTVDGAIPSDPSDSGPMERLMGTTTAEERAQRAKLVVPKVDDPDIAPTVELLEGMFRAWVVGESLMIWG